MEIITIAQQKGGTGKTTTAATIAAGLARQGKRILIIDLDPQTNLSYIMGADTTAATIADVLQGKTPAATATQAIKAETLPGVATAAIIPVSAFLAGADANLQGNRREYLLADALRPLARAFDYCIIDTPPALGILTVNALTAATRVIIPCLPDVLSIQATAQIAATIEGIKQSSNPKIKIAGVLLTRYTPRQNLTKDITDILTDAAQQIGTTLFNTKIRESVTIREAQTMGKDLFSYAPKSKAAEDYKHLIEEIF